MMTELCDCRNKEISYECVECGMKACEDCVTGWQGNICWRCAGEDPVFFDSHSRTHGDVKEQGAKSTGKEGGVCAQSESY